MGDALFHFKYWLCSLNLHSAHTFIPESCSHDEWSVMECNEKTRIRKSIRNVSTTENQYCNLMSQKGERCTPSDGDVKFPSKFLKLDNKLFYKIQNT